MTVSDSQADMRRAYVGGGPGVFVSGLVWLAAWFVERSSGISPAFLALFLGGMIIFPASTLIVRLLFRRQSEAAGNILGRTALESTIAMLGGLLPAYLFLQFEPTYVFPMAAIAVGTHYFVFRTVYGDALFWLLGAIISGLALCDIFLTNALPVSLILLVAVTELVFSVVLTVRDRSSA